MSSAILVMALTLSLSAPWQNGSNPEKTVNVTLSEWKIDMPALLPPGMYILRITNRGDHSHTLKIKNRDYEKKLEKELKPGQSGELRVNLKPGLYEVTCPIGFGPVGHESKGMKLELKVRP